MNIIDLFSGAGGLSLGFEKSGFKPQLAIDMWGDAIETYNTNATNKVGKTIDIHDFTNESLIKFDNIDGIIGGPPCQGFSLVGTRNSNDPRNSLYIEYYRFVYVLKPKFFLIENVPGLLSLEKGKYVQDIQDRFTELGYNVNFASLVASDYGVPQNRRRVFFIGYNKDYFGNKEFDFNQIQHSEIVSTKMAISDMPEPTYDNKALMYDKKPQNYYQEMMRSYSSGIHNHVGTKHSENTIKIISMVPDGGGIKDLPREYYKVRNYNNAFRRMHSNSPSNTIDCGHRNYFHYHENRVPTVRESARIQSFPDNYVFKGSKTSQYTQVGNAVPPLLAQKIAKVINQDLNDFIK